MSQTVTLRLDRDTQRILRELTRRSKTSKSRAIREALRAHWHEIAEGQQRTPWEIYSQLKVPNVKPYHDTARNVEKLLREKLLAKYRNGTL